MVRTRVDRGRLHRRYPGVFVVGHRRLTVRGQWMAATLACGPRALLSHRDVGRLHGMLRGAGTGPGDVSAPGAHRLAGIRCHLVRRPDPRDATVVDGIPATTWACTALDLAPLLPFGRLVDALELAARQRRDLGELHELIARTHGHRGLGRLAAALAEVDDDPPELRSGLEADFRAALRDAGLPLPQTNVVVAGETVDCWWPAAGLVVELDGRRWHRLGRGRVRDARGSMRLERAGLRSVRIPDDLWIADRPGVLDDLTALLGLGPR